MISENWQVMEIKAESYHVWYDPDEGVIHCQGSLRLAGSEEYAPIEELFQQAADAGHSVIVLNLRNLEFLNSSGINFLSKFVIKMRQKENIRIKVLGSNQIPWQGKSLKNLQRLMPSLELDLI